MQKVKLPKINLNELKEQKKKNFEDRIEFIKIYANWLKKQSNKEWSSQQAKIID